MFCLILWPSQNICTLIFLKETDILGFRSWIKEPLFLKQMGSTFKFLVKVLQYTFMNLQCFSTDIDGM